EADAISEYTGLVRRRVSPSGVSDVNPGGWTDQPSLLPPTNRTIPPPQATKMSPSIRRSVTLETSRATARRFWALTGKPLPSWLGEEAKDVRAARANH